MRRLTRRYRRRDNGAIAVIVAILAMLLFTVGALAVDLSNAYSRKVDAQAQADFTAVAGAAELPGPGTSPQATDPAVIAAASYINKNHPERPSARDQLIRPAQLVDGSYQNGEAFYGYLADPQLCSGGGCDTPYGDIIASDEHLTIVSPQTEVTFGLGRALGLSDTMVQAHATAAINTPGTSVMPLYAVAGTGCDYGPQTLAPASTEPDPTSIWEPNDTNGADLSSITPDEVDLDATGAQLTINGSGFVQGTPPDERRVIKVGFFLGTAPPTPPVVEPPPDTDYTVTIPAANVTPGQIVNVPIPTAVTSQEAIWYVRVGMMNGVGGPPPAPAPEFNWSGLLTAQPLRVGDAGLTLLCQNSSEPGAFGSVTLPRAGADTGGGWLATNIALGPQDPMTLHTHPPNDPDQIAAQCNPANPQTVYSAPTSPGRRGTNCVDAIEGLLPDPATSGLISGPSAGINGKLNAPTSTADTGAGGNSIGCAPDGSEAERSVQVGGTDYQLNNDILTCFFTQDMAAQGTTIGELSQPEYAGPQLSSDIYESPRFFWMPVLKEPPASGEFVPNHYSIIDFRPAFITDQPSSASKGNPQVGADNGVTVADDSIQSLHLVLLSKDALPAANDAPTIDYLGTGPRVVRLID
jgi:hypothetical protein